MRQRRRASGAVYRLYEEGLPRGLPEARHKNGVGSGMRWRPFGRAEIAFQGRYTNASMAHPVAFDRSGERARHLRYPEQKSDQLA